MSSSSTSSAISSPTPSRIPSTTASPEPQALARATVQHLRVYRCALCSSDFHTRRIFNLHIRSVHERRRPHHCPHCRVQFGHLVDLNEHIHSLHSDGAHLTELCPFCDVRFATVVHLKYHVRDDHSYRLQQRPIAPATRRLCERLRIFVEADECCSSLDASDVTSRSERSTLSTGATHDDDAL